MRFSRLTLMLLAYDLAATLVAISVTLMQRFETADPAVAVVPYLPLVLLPVVIRPMTYAAFSLYQREWQYASLRELADLAAAVFVGSVLIVLAFVALRFTIVPGHNVFPRSFFLIEPVLSFCLVGAGRLAARRLLERRAVLQAPSAGDAVPTIVYGAGEAGALTARLAAHRTLPGIHLVAFLDDDRSKRGSRLLGKPVLGSLDDLGYALEVSSARQLLIAMPSASGSPIRRAIDAAKDHHVPVKILPRVEELMTAGPSVYGIRDVSVEDLLRREPVDIDNDVIARSINGASVLITGGGGSIGSELARQVLKLGPRSLTLVDHHEWSLWNLERDLAARRRGSEGGHVETILADVRSAAAAESIVRRVKPEVVFHAAALKHVPFVELFPSEGILTNVVGTRNLLRACQSIRVERFVLISTDKAVEPVSVMGATKRLAEELTVRAGRESGRPYVAVRFGNVLGSSGSVVPLLLRQLEEGLPLTITEPEATRYFMTIAEAVSLILEAGSSASVGEVFVLDMGEPIRILDLARDLLRLKGLDPDAATFAITGLRPGERLHEKLFDDDETPHRTAHAGILRAVRAHDEGNALEALVDTLEAAAREYDDQSVREHLRAASYISAAALERTGDVLEPTRLADRRSIVG